MNKYYLVWRQSTSTFSYKSFSIFCFTIMRLLKEFEMFTGATPPCDWTLILSKCYFQFGVENEVSLYPSLYLYDTLILLKLTLRLQFQHHNSMALKYCIKTDIVETQWEKVKRHYGETFGVIYPHLSDQMFFMGTWHKLIFHRHHWVNTACFHNGQRCFSASSFGAREGMANLLKSNYVFHVKPMNHFLFLTYFITMRTPHTVSMKQHTM